MIHGILAMRRPDYLRDTLDDMRAACLVCRAWHACASEVLFTHVHLHTTRDLHRFAHSLSRNPTLASFVKVLHLPEETQKLPERQPDPGRFEFRQRRMRRLGLAVESVLELCNSATDLAFRVNTPQLGAIHGLAQCAPRIDRLELSAGYRANLVQLLTEPVELRFPRDFLTDPPFTHLTLQGLQLASTHDVHFPRLRALYIRFSHAAPGWLGTVLGNSPCIERLHIEGLYIGNLWDAWSSDELRPAAGTLRELRIDWACRDVGIGFPFLANLRTLELSLECVADRGAEIGLPPNLDTLVLSSRGLTLRGGITRGSLLTAVARVKKQLPSWKYGAAPNLRVLGLTGDVYGSKLLDNWTIISCLFGSYCEQLGMSLDVAL